MEYQLPYYNWSKAAVLLNEVGLKLQASHGDAPLTKREIEDDVVSTGIYKRQSVFPSDYCYNLINKYNGSFRFPLFIWLKRGSYLHVGPYYHYSGPILWKGMQVGEWKDGQYVLWEDPRQ